MAKKPNGEIKIEKGVPVPQGNPRAARYPLASMEIGDSFVVSLEDRHAVQGATYMYGRYHGCKFKTRTVNGGVRVWRLS